MPRDPQSFRKLLLELACEYECLCEEVCKRLTEDVCGPPIVESDGLATENEQISHGPHSISLRPQLPDLHLDFPPAFEIEETTNECATNELSTLRSLSDGLAGRMLQLEPDFLHQKSIKSVFSISTTKPISRSILSPVGDQRLCWDVIAIVLVVFELWRLPFEMVYLSMDAIPIWHLVISILVTLFFFCDIALNFFTGIILREGIEVRPLNIASTYFSSWFIVDVCAMIPMDLFLAAGGNLMASRVLKIFRLLKSLRFVRFFRALRRKRSMLPRSPTALSRLLKLTSQATLILCLFAHMNGVIYAAIHDAWTPTSDYDEALGRYWRSFWWGYVTFLQSSPVPLHLGGQQLLEVVVKGQSVCLGITVMFSGFLHVKVASKDEASVSKLKHDTMRYLRQHRVSLPVQIQVLQTLNETARLHTMQKNFDEVVSGSLPQELRRTIGKELWSVVIKSFSLFQQVSLWSDDFVDELCVLAYQEAFPSNATVFTEGDQTIAAYCIISGEVALRTISTSIPERVLSRGMWIGERALVHAKRRRAHTAITVKLAIFMTIESKPFWELLDRIGLKDQYTALVEDRLWRGLCGRCGKMGDHFSEDCWNFPSQHEEAGDLTSRVHRVLSYRNGNSTPVHVRRIPSSLPPGSDLRLFLEKYELTRLEPHLIKIGVRSLAALERMDESLRTELERLATMSGYILSEANWASLSSERVSQFGKNQASSQDRHLMFLSHYKVEAGTEASLMHTELEQILARNAEGSDHSAPIFLDSEDLIDLDELKTHVRNSQNIILLLTPGVLSRPWVLLELAVAFSAGIPIVPVIVSKEGLAFEIPSETQMSSSAVGAAIGEKGVQLVRSAGYEMEDVERALRAVFVRIAVTYSPHRSANIRRAELEALLKCCSFHSVAKARHSGLYA